jgi:hypothetical protein
MSGFKLNLFSGLRPRMPESLLPDGAATIAENCDFAYGELRNTKGGFAYLAMSNAPGGLYTDEGLAFYSWTGDVNAVRSPLASDTFDCMYYTGDGGFKVANRLGTRINGGPPSSSYLVGVPRPTLAPTLAALLPTPVNASNATIVFKFHWEYGGVKYQEQAISPSIISESIYRFSPPAIDASTPDTAFPVLRMTANWSSDGSQIFDLYTGNSSFDSTGGLYSLSMAKDAGENVTTYTGTLSTAVKESDKETRAYVYTYVNTYGEEGPPSPPGLVTTSPVLGVAVTAVKDSHTGYSPIKEIRIYRTPTGSTIADYFYVGTLGVLSGNGSSVFTDNVKGEMLNELLSSTEYYPPNQNLVGLMQLPNGILCAWKGNELHFSEAYKPWAWPPKYVKTLPTNIVGGIVHGSGAVVTTRAHPHLVSGISPDSMTVSKVNVDQAGASKWSIAVVDGVVMYASNDGLVALTGATASLMQGQKFFTREVWRQRYAVGLSLMRFAVWDGRLVVFAAGNAFTPFMIRFDEADGTMTDLPGFAAQCAFVSPLSDQFYYTNGSTLYQFNAGSAAAAVWQSSERVLQRPCNFGIAQALVEGAWSVEWWAFVKNPTSGAFEYQLKHTQALTTGLINFRLPSGFESDRYRVKISGTGRFRELRVAQTARELVTL